LAVVREWTEGVGWRVNGGRGLVEGQWDERVGWRVIGVGWKVNGEEEQWGGVGGQSFPALSRLNIIYSA